MGSKQTAGALHLTLGFFNRTTGCESDAMIRQTSHVDLAGPPKELGTVLVVDEQDSSRLLTKWFFSAFGYTVDCARSVAEATRLFDPEVHDLVITDGRRARPGGLDMAQIVKKSSPSTPVLLFSAEPPAHHSCFDAFVSKPGHLLLLKSAADKIFAARK